MLASCEGRGRVDRGRHGRPAGSWRRGTDRRTGAHARLPGRYHPHSRVGADRGRRGMGHDRCSRPVRGAARASVSCVACPCARRRGRVGRRAGHPVVRNLGGQPGAGNARRGRRDRRHRAGCGGQRSGSRRRSAGDPSPSSTSVRAARASTRRGSWSRTSASRSPAAALGHGVAPGGPPAFAGAADAELRGDSAARRRRIASAAIAMGPVGPCPIRAHDAEAFLRGQAPLARGARGGRADGTLRCRPAHQRAARVARVPAGGAARVSPGSARALAASRASLHPIMT